MATVSNHYDIFGLPATASVDEIKSAFRKSALLYHPDRNTGPESAARFRIIYNAYSVLSNSTRRREYDAYLRTSRVFGDPGGIADAPIPKPSHRQIRGAFTTVSIIMNHLNYILWDIEDLMRSNPDWERNLDGLPLRGYVLKMLSFIDKWILSTTGYPDYFFQARKISTPVEAGTPYQGVDTGHRPFANMSDYFYNIRARTNKLLNRAKLIDLLEPVPGTEICIMDCIFEAHNLSFHYLGYLKKVLAGESEKIPPFRHSKPCFDNR